MVEKLAEQGWFVRVETVGVAFQPAVMDFAVGKNSAQEALSGRLASRRAAFLLGN